MNDSSRTFLHWCRRYISLNAVVIAGVLVFILFFNDNSVMRHYAYEKQIEELKARIKENNDTLMYYRELNSRLDTDPETMERIVREQYHMQRPGEDVYVVYDED